MTSWKKYWSQLWFLVRSLIPTTTLLFYVLLGVLVILIGSIWGLGAWAFGIYNGLLLILIGIDIRAIQRYPKLTAHRNLETLFEIREENQVRIQLASSAPLYTEMWIQDDFPQGFQVNQRTFSFTWSGELEKNITYFAKPHRRGRHRFGDIHIRMRSPFQLFLYQQKLSGEMEVHVYPSLEPTRKVRKGVYEKHFAEEGISVARSFGTGREFSHLREYRSDDESKRINWMATARLGKLVSNVYQPEISQQVAILLDCGRLMGVQDQGQSRLDIALEAVLGFAAIALERGDEVSLIAFSDRVLRFVPPRKGIGQLRKIVEACYDLEPSYTETDFLTAWEQLSRTHKQKTLVALFTDMANLSFSETINPMVRFTQRQHLLLTVSIQDSNMMEKLNQIAKNETEIYERWVTESLYQERKAILRKWGNQKFITLDVKPNQLASQVIYKYLEIRRRASS